MGKRLPNATDDAASGHLPKKIASDFTGLILTKTCAKETEANLVSSFREN